MKRPGWAAKLGGTPIHRGGGEIWWLGTSSVQIFSVLVKRTKRKGGLEVDCAKGERSTPKIIASGVRKNIPEPYIKNQGFQIRCFVLSGETAKKTTTGTTTWKKRCKKKVVSTSFITLG